MWAELYRGSVNTNNDHPVVFITVRSTINVTMVQMNCDAENITNIPWLFSYSTSVLLESKITMDKINTMFVNSAFLELIRKHAWSQRQPMSKMDKTLVTANSLAPWIPTDYPTIRADSSYQESLGKDLRKWREETGPQSLSLTIISFACFSPFSKKFKLNSQELCLLVEASTENDHSNADWIWWAFTTCRAK